LNSYNPYSGSKKKIFRNVITVLVCAVLIFGATVIFGNHLKNKAEKTSDSDYIGVGRDDIYDDTEGEIIPPLGDGIVLSENVRGVTVPLGGVPKDNVGTSIPPKTFSDALENAAGSTAVVIPLTDGDGYLLYNSIAAGEFSRLPINPLLPDTDILSACVSAAKTKGFRTVALISAGVSISDDSASFDRTMATDAAIVGDAQDVGFDEIIITSLVSSPEEFDGDGVTLMLKYLKNITASAKEMAVGVAFPPEVYRDVTLSPRIELLLNTSVFPAMELSEEKSTDEYVTFVTEKLSGTLSVYNMRLLLSPATDRICESIISLFEDVGHSNYLITTLPEIDDSPVTETPITDEPTTTPPKPVVSDSEPPATAPEKTDAPTEVPDTTPEETTVSYPETTEPVTEVEPTTPPETEVPSEIVTENPVTEPVTAGMTEALPDPFTDTDIIPL